MLLTLFKRLHLKQRRIRSVEITDELSEWIQKICDDEELPASELVEELLKTGLEHWLLREAAVERWYSLTRREREVALLILQDLPHTQMARRLAISKETVRSHISSILEKFDVHSMDELRQSIRRAGILTPRQADSRKVWDGS